MNLNDRQLARNANILDLTQKVCEAMSLPFSVNAANQSLADIPDSDRAGDAQLFNAIGQLAGIRFNEVESTFRELVLAVFESAPIIVETKEPTSASDSHYFVILRSKGRSRFVIQMDGREQVVSARWIKKHARRNEDGAFTWFLPQAIFAVEGASAYNFQSGDSGKPLSPMRRYFALLKPETRDLRIVLVFAIFVGILSLTTPLAVEALVNTVAFGRYLQPLLILALIVFIFLAFRSALAVLMAIVVEFIQRRLFIRVVDDLASRLAHVPTSYLKSHHGPELVNRFFDVVNVQKVTSKLLLDSLMLVLQTAIGLTVLAFYHPFLLGYDIGLLALMGVVLFVIGRGAVNSAKKESQLKYETAAWLQEIIRHPTTFKFNGGLSFAVNRADELAASYVRARENHFRILIRQVSFSLFMQAVAATVLLGLGGYLVIERQMTLGQLVAAELIVTAILGSFAKVGKDLESVYDLLASVDKLGKLFDLPGERLDKLQLAPQEGPGKLELVKLNCGRRELNLSVEPGSVLAIKGKSGSGKTKTIETIAGMHKPNSGHALLNGFRVDLIGSESLQTRMGFVNEVEIFEGSVDENLRMGRSDVNSVAMNEVIQELGLHDTLTRLPEGLRTKLYISGYPLSSGQAIRFVLARALIFQPSVLLIDSLLDRLADEDLVDVLQSLDKFKSTTTIVLTTGRQTIADWADTTLEA